MFYNIKLSILFCVNNLMGKDLMKTIVDSSQEEYVRIQHEVLLYLDWLKMFTQAYIKRD
jgi:hypothetical protein